MFRQNDRQRRDQPLCAFGAQAPSAPASSLCASEGTLVPIYGPLVLSQVWAKARRRFSAQAFSVGEGDTLRCPAGMVLRPRERRKMPSGDLRVLYAPGLNDCRSCVLASECLGRGASGEQPRRVSGVRRVVGWQVQPRAAGEQPRVVSSPAEPQQQNAQQGRYCNGVMLAGDGSGVRWSHSYAANR